MEQGPPKRGICVCVYLCVSVWTVPGSCVTSAPVGHEWLCALLSLVCPITCIGLLKGACHRMHVMGHARLWKVLLLLLLLTSSSRICLCPVCSLSSFMMSVFVIVAFLCVGGKAGGVWCFCILTTLVIVCFLCEACFPHSPWHHRNAMCAHGSLSHFCQPCHCLFPCLVHSDSPGCSSEVQMEDVAPALWPRDGTQKWSLAYGLCVL